MGAARIFQLSKNAMQSGKALAGRWVLEFESEARKRADPLTGWSGGADTQAQVSLNFNSVEDAVRYADKNGIDYHIIPTGEAKLKLQSYADKFK